MSRIPFLSDRKSTTPPGAPSISPSITSLIVHSLSVGFLVWSISIFLASPSLNVVFTTNTEDYDRFRDTFSRQIENPFYRPGSNEQWEGGFLAYRIAIPFISHYLGLNAWGGVVTIWLAGLITIALIYFNLRTRGVSSELAFWSVLGLGFTPVLQGSHTYLGYPDAFSWLLTAILMLSKAPTLWAILTFVGLFNDERTLITLPLALAVLLFDQRASLLRTLYHAWRYIAAIILGVGVAYLVRQGIQQGYIGDSPVLGNALPYSDFPSPITAYHIIGMLLAFKLFWCLPLISAINDRCARPFWVIILLYCASFSYILTYVGDYWRSLACFYPIFILSILTLSSPNLTFSFRAQNLVKYLAIFMMLLPQIEQMGNHIRWLRPLPISVMEWYQGASFLRSIFDQ